MPDLDDVEVEMPEDLEVGDNDKVHEKSNPIDDFEHITIEASDVGGKDSNDVD